MEKKVVEDYGWAVELGPILFLTYGDGEIKIKSAISGAVLGIISQDAFRRFTDDWKVRERLSERRNNVEDDD